MARLPIIGQDLDHWGEVLNEFLLVGHNEDGSPRSTSRIGAGPTPSVHDYGAVGDGQTDDTDALQAAFDGVVAIDGEAIFFPAGTYLISHPLTIPSGLEVYGAGSDTIVKATQSGWGGAYMAMFVLERTENTVVRDMVVDQDGLNRAAANAIQFSILLAGANDCRLENIIFKNPGLQNSHPGGPVLELLAKDEDGDRDEGVIGSCSGNIVRRCTFELPPQLNLAFAIRMLTNWEKKRPTEAFVHLANGNVIDRCRFIGDFDWNMIELAGGGTVGNEVRYCEFAGRTLSAIDFDKGASHNRAVGNVISGGGKPDKHLGNSNTRLAVINDHGYAADYLNVGNVILHNRIENIDNPATTDVYESAISVSYSRCSQVVCNQIDSLNQARVGRGIVVDRECYGATIRNNVVVNTAGGLSTNFSGSNYRDLTIANNQFDVAQDVIALGSSGGDNRRLTLTRNSCISASGQTNLVVGGNFPHPMVTGNDFVGGEESMKLFADRATIEGNECRGSSVAIFLFANAIIVANHFIDIATADIVVASGSPTPVLAGNHHTHPPQF